MSLNFAASILYNIRVGDDKTEQTKQGETREPGGDGLRGAGYSAGG